MSHLETRVLSHKQRVCRLYRLGLKTLRDHYYLVYRWRYFATILRSRFDKNKDIKDMILAKRMLLDGEREWQECRHPQPIIYPSSPGGVAYQRNGVPNDMCLDYWHPLEKMQYPNYFKTRELRKIEYARLYAEKYGRVKIPLEK